MKIQTVNVIEILGPMNLAVHSFPDNAEGNAAAQKFFGDILREQKMDNIDDNEIPVFDDQDIKVYTDNGYAEHMGWELYLIRSCRVVE